VGGVMFNLHLKYTHSIHVIQNAKYDSYLLKLYYVTLRNSFSLSVSKEEFLLFLI
jgi:hypothetical protein